MADHYEHNIPRMVGVRPAHNADPIPVGKIPHLGSQLVRGTHADNNTVIIHTVTIAKTLYLSLAVHTIQNYSGASGNSDFYVTNAEDAVQYYFSRLASLDDYGHGVSLPFLPPLEIPAGYKIIVNSSGATVVANVFLHGYEM